MQTADRITSMKLTLLLCLFACCAVSHAQPRPAGIVILDSGRACSIRGMSTPGNDVVWVSGSNGHVGRTTDGGKTWKWSVVAGYEGTDFRDIHAFDAATAVIMGIGNPAYILKTRDGGVSWKTVFTKAAPGMFLDAMDFLPNGEGVCIGDPMDAGGGKRTFFVIRSSDSGDTWQAEDADRLPPAVAGEAVFSASGSNIALLHSKTYDYAFISGGLVSRFYLIGRKAGATKVYPLRMVQGTESTGAFSMATDRGKRFYCAGGDYKAPEDKHDNFVWTMNGGKLWQTADWAAAFGYRSCICIIGPGRLIACGPNGVDEWTGNYECAHISSEGFNVCAPTPGKKLVFFGGGKGKIGMMRF